MDWVTIDFEASCLPRHGRSFPIEVGVSGLLGTCSWLIRPTTEWRLWDWTEEAARLHGITRVQLDDQGLSPETVISEVRRAIGSARVISDSSLDRVWWQTLLDAAEPTSPLTPVETAPRPWGAIDIEHVGDVFDEVGATAEQIHFARQRADAICPDRHRAGSDAHWLFVLLTTLSQRIAADRSKAARKSFPSWTEEDAYVRNLRQLQIATADRS